MARYHNAELPHFDFYLITLAKELQFPLTTSIWTILMIQTKKSPDWGQSDFQYQVDITQHFGKHYTSFASSAYPHRDYKFGQILSRYLSFALPFADTNDHHGTTSYVIKCCIIVDQHPLHRELPSTSQRSSSAPIDQHTPFNDPTSSIIPFVSARTIHEQFKLTCHPYRSPLPSSMATQSTIST